MIGREGYVGFFIDWVIELACLIADILSMIASGSLYVGIWLYISAMVKDMKMRMISFAECAPEQSTSSTCQMPILSIDADFGDEPIPLDTWPSYVQEIILHVDIIR